MEKDESSIRTFQEWSWMRPKEWTPSNSKTTCKITCIARKTDQQSWPLAALRSCHALSWSTKLLHEDSRICLGMLWSSSYHYLWDSCGPSYFECLDEPLHIIIVKKFLHCMAVFPSGHPYIANLIQHNASAGGREGLVSEKNANLHPICGTK